MRYKRLTKTAIIGIVGTLLCSALVSAQAPSAFDLVILNGRVMDPETGHDAVKNVAVRDGKIAAITSRALKGNQTIDAQGLVVAPGFIDLHNHSQNADGYRRSVQDGVTTSLELEVGVFPVARWYQQRTHQAPINYGASVSHPLVRALAFDAIDPAALTGASEHDLQSVRDQKQWSVANATPEQHAKVKQLLHQGLKEGGLGIGYHLVYTPGSNVAEMLDLYEFSARQQVTNFVHIRSLGQVSPIQSGHEIVHAAATTGASIHVVHINSSGLWETRELLNILSEAQKNGVDVSTEVYPYNAAPSNLTDPRITREGGLAIFRIDYSDLELLESGERLTQASFMELKRNKPETEVIAHIMSQDNVDMAVAHPMVMIASDSVDLSNGKGHPRGAATYAHILGHYVRENGSLTLMQALRKMSLLPAQRLQKSVPQMRLRGRLQEGMIADITIFDTQRIAGKADYIKADLPSAGISHVIVNGTPVVADYQLLEKVYPGLPIRRTQPVAN
ncbi:amidohydrolase family protein [Pseudomaricurvus alkylphenolicus]|uniref:amidohydrolase family protein n=1 Tax=Pseudomaricurvus alkylphenolicus TaxID=1306991 RepID=UPI00141E12D7|nr:amidohydrolase family protein [Pseudomaricurvus alkylphenolicus]NIB38419.1 amidohydrolase family protein [Pseudomaricurvus alkylphenolicus]